MSIKVLPDSRITSMVKGNDIYAYAQTYEGDIYQFVGNVENANAFYGSRKKSSVIVERLKGKTARPGAPKTFTPLAAVAFTDDIKKPMTEKYIFYLDDNNILHDQWESGDGDYKEGGLAALKVQCAHYSGLAAVTFPGNIVNFISVFYQTPGSDGAVKIVSFAGRHRHWQHGTPNIRDPPLYGTSITAVPARTGILGRANRSHNKDDEGQPIYYLQLDSNALGSGQGAAEPLPLSGYDRDDKPIAFSPHTSLTAVDNGTELHLIYKSHTGKIKVIRIHPSDGLQLPELFFTDVDVAPRSSIAACIAPNTGSTMCIVLFYQSLDQDSRKVQMGARVVYRPLTAATDTKWNVSAKEDLAY